MVTEGHHLGELVSRQANATQVPPPSHADPFTNAPRIIAIVAALTGVSALLVILRCYVRAVILRRFQIEDAIMIGSLACAGGVLACFIAECEHGLGRFTADIPLTAFGSLLQWMWWHAIIIVMGISLVKISIGFFLLRFVAQKKLLKGFIMGSLVFLVLFTIACELTLILQCIPVAAAWNFALKANAKCYSQATYLKIGQFNSAINIITDFIFATLPVLMFYDVQVNKRTKVSLMGILSLGYFACAAAIAKAVLQAQVYDDPESFRDANFLIWNCIELNVGIIAASFPTIKPLVKSIIGSTRGFTYGSRSRKRTGNTYYGNGTYGPSSHAMASMKRSRVDPEEQKYHVQIRAHHPSLSGSDGGSEENLPVRAQQVHILPSSRIMQTTEVIVQSEDNGSGEISYGGGIGPRRTVEDRI